MGGGASACEATAILVAVFDGLAQWWGAVELWLAQQWFPVQFVLVMAVVVPLCFGLTVLGDRVCGAVVSWQRRRRAGHTPARRSS